MPAHRIICSIVSPSSRRAWIEILQRLAERLDNQVALLAEGVDRNASLTRNDDAKSVALLAEGVDRNKSTAEIIAYNKRSPSSRRAWIEITDPAAS